MKIKLSLIPLALAGLLAGGAIAIPLVLAGLLAGGATADEVERSVPSAVAPRFESLDANRDGAITTEEAGKTWLANSFKQVDTDRDGLVSKAEYEYALS